MKKTYIIPAIEVELIDMEENLLTTSGGVTDGSLLGNDFKDSDITFSREETLEDLVFD